MDGSFSNFIGNVPLPETGVLVPRPTTSTFYRVATVNGCGTGPLN
jgi:hypothetical protein